MHIQRHKISPGANTPHFTCNLLMPVSKCSSQQTINAHHCRTLTIIRPSRLELRPRNIAPETSCVMSTRETSIINTKLLVTRAKTNSSAHTYGFIWFFAISILHIHRHMFATYLVLFWFALKTSRFSKQQLVKFEFGLACVECSLAWPTGLKFICVYMNFKNELLSGSEWVNEGNVLCDNFGGLLSAEVN